MSNDYIRDVEGLLSRMTCEIPQTRARLNVRREEKGNV